MKRAGWDTPNRLFMCEHILRRLHAQILLYLVELLFSDFALRIAAL